jgi:hypothetical protein
MVTVRPVGPDYEFEIWADPPLLYLDHWAIRRLSEDPVRGGRFLAAFEHRGTVMFSLMNVVEIARDADGHRAKQIRDFLERLGPHWVPMTIDPIRIINAEDSGTTPDGANPCVSAAFLSDSKFAARLTSGAVSLVHVVDLTRGSDGDELRRATDRDTARLRQNIQEWRDAHAKNPREIDSKYPLLKFDSKKPMRSIYYGLARFSITDTFRLDDNHARDLFHAVASVRCAEMVTLDAHWAGQVRKLKLPADFVRVYSQSELDQFLVDLEAAPATR